MAVTVTLSAADRRGCDGRLGDLDWSLTTRQRKPTLRRPVGYGEYCCGFDSRGRLSVETEDDNVLEESEPETFTVTLSNPSDNAVLDPAVEREGLDHRQRGTVGERG